MQEAERPASVRVAQVGQRAARCQLVEEVDGLAGFPEGRHPLLELVGDLRHVAHHVADEDLARGLLGEVGQVGEGLGHALVADEQWRPGKLCVDGRPIGETGRHLEAPGRRVGRRERAQPVAGADQAMGRRADRAGQQARAPTRPPRPRRAVGQLALEEGLPVGEPVLTTERGRPLLLGQRLARRRAPRRVECGTWPPTQGCRPPGPCGPAPRPPSVRGSTGPAARTRARWRRRR